jgi:threonine/homoserine/homoserine lactone efflux protein
MLDVGTLVKIVTVSISGALSPGPLTASSIALGAKGGWKRGFGIAIGHTLFEFPLVLVLAYGLGAFFQVQWLRIALGFMGGFFLLFFAVLTMREVLSVKTLESSKNPARYDSPITMGFALTALNPYFLAWWIGVGSPLMLQALTVISFTEILVFYLAHVWLDYFWLVLVAAIGSASKINFKLYRITMILLAMMIVYFGVDMILATLRIILPSSRPSRSTT